MLGSVLVLCASALQAPGAHPALQRLPLRFEPNVGQARPGVRFLARGAAPAVAITDRGAVLAGGVALHLVGARPHPRVRAEQPLPGRSHYFRGRDPRGWRTDVPQYAAVRYSEVYPGVDLALHGAEGHLEYDFELAPGADPSRIHLRLSGAERATVDAAGNLIVQGPAGELVQRAPVAFQEKGGRRVSVPARFMLRGNDIRFVVGPYDTKRRLVIDPVLSYSSYFGGNGDESVGSVVYDRDGNMIVAGSTNSTIFPLRNPLQPGLGGEDDAFVAKLSADGSTLIYSTYLGGSDYDWAGDLAVDAFGNAVLAGSTRSGDFPVVNALQSAHAGGTWDLFVAKLSPSGSALAFSTYLGGSQFDYGPSVSTDRAGNAYLTGTTTSPDFPLRDPIQPAPAGAQDFFVAKLDARGSALLYSTFLGGTQGDFPTDIAVDGGRRAVVAGFTWSANFPVVNALQPTHAGGFYDAVIVKVQADGRSLVYSTYLGGSLDEQSGAVAVDAAGNAYVVGRTQSTNFPLVNPAQSTFGGWEDAFAAKINPSGSALVYSTYLGGLDLDRPYAVTVDESGSAYFGGETDSRNLPVVNALQPTHGGGRYDAFAARLSPSGSQVLWSTYLGGFGDDAVFGLAAGRTGDLALGGFTASPNWPLVRPLQAQATYWEGFVARISAGAMTPLALITDTVPGPGSDANAVLDPGETATLIPGWRHNGTAPLSLTGQATALSGPGPATYSVVDGSAGYGVVPGGGLIDCYNATGDCYRVRVDAAGRPVLHWDATLSESLSNGDARQWAVHVGASFSDVARSSPYYRFVETLMHAGITTGCGGSQYCPGVATAREQMAVFVLAAQDGPSPPPACVAGQEMFADLPATNPSCRFVEELARRGVVAGCGNGNFCPGASVSREQMAVFTLATREGPTFRPPACVAGAERFGDVPTASPFCAWIEELAVRGVVTGCGGGLYCPTASVTREQMGVFIAATFRLSLYTP